VKEQLVYLGVDIAKHYLDAAIGGEKRRFANEAVGHRQLIRWINQIDGAVQMICEPSGGYERALIRALVGAKLKVSLAPANRVRQFARAAGILAKTDRIDAKVLCTLRRQCNQERSAPLSSNRTICESWRVSVGM
jgi:transposase